MTVWRAAAQVVTVTEQWSRTSSCSSAQLGGTASVYGTGLQRTAVLLGMTWEQSDCFHALSGFYSGQTGPAGTTKLHTQPRPQHSTRHTAYTVSYVHSNDGRCFRRLQGAVLDAAAANTHKEKDTYQQTCCTSTVSRDPAHIQIASMPAPQGVANMPPHQRLGKHRFTLKSA